ncbi:mito ribosomal protein S21 [Zalerion maritima]|uniref:Mito ribosomal protein S21 n=1 Tax=Zalerion maritima TaxID=339359 RepID=A0AAD5RLP6_9PEZI|nr:mito ribosomal protein S21 [Zalerion maritima]
MESPRLLVQPASRVASLLSRSQCRLHVCPFKPSASLRLQTAFLSTSSSRRAPGDNKGQKSMGHMSRWFDPKNTSAQRTTSAPPPPPPPRGSKKSNSPSPSSTDGAAFTGPLMAWSSFQQTAASARSQKNKQSQLMSDLNDNIMINVSDLLRNPPSNSPEALARRNSFEGNMGETKRPGPFFRRRPETGTMVQIKPSGKWDLLRALSSVNVAVRLNQIKWQSIRQREHERPGLKRKRMRGVRWRKLFSEGYKNTVKRANALAKMGW